MDKEERNRSQPPVQPQGVKFSLSKPNWLGRRPPLPPKKEKTSGGREEDEEEEQEDLEYVTGFDEKLGLVAKDPERRRRGGVKVVPKLENSWRPEKRMKNIVMESDVTKPTEETFEMETMAAGPEPDVQYGLTVLTRVQEQTTITQGVAAAAASAPPRRPSSFQEMEEQKLREDLSLLPEESSLERYEELPVEEFGEALLRGMGWEKGKPIGRNSKTAVAPVEYVRRHGREGLGATPLPPKENNTRIIKFGPKETRFITLGEARFAQPHTSERVRPDLKLVERIRKKSGIVIGKFMSVIAGEHVGWRGEIISLGDRIGSRQDDVVVMKLARTGDEVVVSSTDLAEVGSLEEESLMDDDMHDVRIASGNSSIRVERHDPRSSRLRWHEDHRNKGSCKLAGRTSFGKQMAGPISPVIRLFPIDPEDDVNKNFDVIFFHGLPITGGTAPQEGYKKTWTTKDNILWPQEWLPKDLKYIRVFSLSYDTEVTKWFATGNSQYVDAIGENLVKTLMMGIEDIGCRPFALVGHSFGGLVIKAFVNATKKRSEAAQRHALNSDAIDRANKFLQNLKGIVFYSVPHTGADAHSLARYFEFRGLLAMVKDLRPLIQKMAKMSVLTEDAFYKKGVIIFAFGEGKPTFSNKMVVESASAMQLAGHNFYKLEDCDHMQVCKPPNQRHPSYSILLKVLRVCSKGLDPPNPDAPKLPRELAAQAAAQRQNDEKIIVRCWERT